MSNDFVSTWWKQNEEETLKILRSRLRPIAAQLSLGLDEATRELWVEAAETVFKKSHEFDLERGSMRAWVLGIALVITKQWKTRRYEESKRTVQPSQQMGGREAEDGALEVWERLQSKQHTERDVVGGDWVERTLEAVSDEDRFLIKSIVLDGASSEEAVRGLARWKNGATISPGAARVRVHRALQRLRAQLPPQERELTRRGPHSAGEIQKGSL